PNSDASLGALRETPISGATLTWRFRGTNVDIVAPVGPSRGTAYVKINGAYTLANSLPLNSNGQATIDFYAPEPQARRRIPVASGLPDRVHEVELIVTGEHHPASNGSGVGIDAVAVWRARPRTPLLALVGGWGITGMALLWVLRARLLAIVGVSESGGIGVSDFHDFHQPRRARNGALRHRLAVPESAAWLLAYLWNLPWAQLSVFAVIASLPIAPLMVRTPIGSYSPVELASLLAMGVFVLRLFWGTERLALSGAFLGPALLLVLGGISSTLAADYPRLALRELRTLIVEPAIFYVVARSALHGRRDAGRLALMLIAASTVAAVLAIVQGLVGAGLVAAEGVTRATALYPSPNHLGLVLGKAVPLAIAGGVYLRGRLQQVLGIAGCVCLIAVFLTFSRGAWLATAIALAVVLMPRLRDFAASHRKADWLGLALALPLVLAGLLFALRFERFSSLFSAAGTGLLRVHLWGSALRMALDHPLLGVGLDQFLYHYPRYMHADAWREPNLSHPHNLLLDFWLRLGLVGLIALVWAATVFVRSLLRVNEAAPDPDQGQLRWLKSSAAGMAVAFVLHGLVDNSYFLIDLAYMVWVMLLIAELTREAPARD
ncbi:MAG TPA: O-antigen ligase family protein, partial [Chloroflexota bacterium]|nr:O-antigen ligase family protein [Chloroflexota bacterium]